jgi:hypothetical protein
MTTPEPNDISALDRATHDRLAKLSTVPVDTARLDQLLRARIPPEGTAPTVPTARRRHRMILRPRRAVAAAALLVLGIVAAGLLSTSGGPVQASPAQMAQFHHELVSGSAPAMQVDSIEAANRMLAGQASGSPQLPGVPAEHVMACCMRTVKNRKVACVLLKNQGAPITMTVANAADMALPRSPRIIRNGVTYHVQSWDALNMVMTERHGRWVCLIGQVPSQRLMDLADQLQF